MAEQSHLGRFIRECRTSLKYTSRKVAALSGERPDLPGISGSYLLAVEKGNHIPRLDKVITLAEVFNVPVHHFVDQCRLDMGVAADAPAGASFAELSEAAAEYKAGGDLHRALAAYKQAFQLLLTNGNGNATTERQALIVKTRLEVATCYRLLHNPRVAREELQAVLRERPLAGDIKRRALLNLAEAHREAGDLTPAAACAEKALSLAREAQDAVFEGKVLFALANIEVEEGQIDAATRRYREALALFRKAGDERLAAAASLHLAIAAIEGHDYDAAIDALKRLVTVFTALGDQRHLIYVHFGLAKAHFLGGNLHGAKPYARTAKDMAEKAGIHDVAFGALYYLWQIARREKLGRIEVVYRERLRYFLGKLDAKSPEAAEFERAVAQGGPWS